MPEGATLDANLQRPSLRRPAGGLLVSGFSILMVAALLFAFGMPGGTAVQTLVLEIGLVVTILGIVAFGVVLADAGERMLAIVGAITFLMGSLLWIVGNTVAAAGPWIGAFERQYVVLASASAAAYGWAILRAKVFSAWIGWVAIGWSAFWITIYLAQVVTAPLGLNLVTLMFGICLLGRSEGFR